MKMADLDKVNDRIGVDKSLDFSKSKKKLSILSKFGQNSYNENRFTLKSIKNPPPTISSFIDNEKLRGRTKKVAVCIRKSYKQPSLAKLLLKGQSPYHNRFKFNFHELSPTRKRSKNTVSTNDNNSVSAKETKPLQ